MAVVNLPLLAKSFTLGMGSGSGSASTDGILIASRSEIVFSQCDSARLCRTIETIIAG